MKNIILALFLVLFSVHSFAYYAGDYCPFNGINDDLNHSHEEFAMLLESKDKPNFMAMGDAAGVITLAPMEDLNNPNCKISGYAKQLIEYYQKHKDEIKNNDPEIAELLDLIRKKLGMDKAENTVQDEP